MQRRWTGILVAAVACAGVVVWAQQGQPRPGPGSGVMTVQGTLNVGNTPAVRQEGDWRMAIANTPSVTVANSPVVNLAVPAFVKSGSKYQIIWSTGETEQITAADGVGTGQWLRVAGSERWINLALARSVTVLR